MPVVSSAVVARFQTHHGAAAFPSGVTALLACCRDWWYEPAARPPPLYKAWMSQPCCWRASEDNPHGSGAGMHHAPPLSQRPSSRVKTPAIRGFLTRDNVILTCPAAQSGENGLITDAHLQQRGCGIHVLWERQRPGPSPRAWAGSDLKASR